LPQRKRDPKAVREREGGWEGRGGGEGKKKKASCEGIF